MKKYLRHREDGEIMNYSDRLATHPKMEVVTEQEAYPERFVGQPLAARLLVVRATVDTPPTTAAMAVPDEVITPPAETTVTPELMADGARGFGRQVGIVSEGSGAIVVGTPPKAQESSALPAGLAGLENI